MNWCYNVLSLWYLHLQNLKNHRDYVICRRLKNVHNDFVDKILHVPQSNVLLSNAKRDSKKSLVMQKLNAESSMKVFHHAKVLFIRKFLSSYFQLAIFVLISSYLNEMISLLILSYKSSVWINAISFKIISLIQISLKNVV